MNRGAIMKRLAVLLQTTLFIATASVAYSQSLADIANKEKERRGQVQNEKVITGEEAAKYHMPTATPAVAEPAAKEEPAPGTGAAADAEAPDPDEPVDFQGRPESYWRKTMTEARKKVADLELEANAIVVKISELQTKFYNIDDGFQREDVGREINKAFYEQDKNKEELANAKDILLELEKEARKSGALPGWIR